MILDIPIVGERSVISGLNVLAKWRLNSKALAYLIKSNKNLKNINNLPINRVHPFNLGKYAAFIRSCLDTILVMTVGFVAGPVEAGYFYANYYVLFVFGFSAIALETLGQARKNIFKVKSTYKLIFYPYLLALVIFFYFNFDNLFSVIIIGIASTISIINSIIFVEEEVKTKDNKILLPAIIPRLFSIFFTIFFLRDHQLNWLNVICTVYLTKESSEIFINIYSYKKIFHLNKIKNGYLEKSLGENWVSDILLVSLSTAFDPILRYVILIAIGPQFVFVYEYMSRIPRIVSSSWMQITRHTLFSENSVNKETKSYNLFNIFLFTINLLLIFIMCKFDFIDDSVLKVLIIINSSLNLLLAVSGYNKYLKIGDIKYLNFSYIFTLMVSSLVLFLLRNDSYAIYFVILCNSLCFYISMNSRILKKLSRC